MMQVLDSALPAEHPLVPLMLIGCASLFTVAFGWLADSVFRRLDLDGKALVKLHADLMTTMVQLTPSASLEHPPSKVTIYNHIMTITNHCFDFMASCIRL